MTDRPPRPVVENAPGLKWRWLKLGVWEARWRPRADLVKAGFPLKIVVLWNSRGEPTEAEKALISDKCRKLQTDMLIFSRGVTAPDGGIVEFDGTLAGLIAVYKTDPVSNYARKGGLRYVTKRQYKSQMARIGRDRGHEILSQIMARDIRLWHIEWEQASGPVGAYNLTRMLSILFRFGLQFLEKDKAAQLECTRLSTLVGAAKFAGNKRREEYVTADQAIAVRAKAREMGRPSIAMAQAFQFDCTMRQKDVIGEWVPLSEPPTVTGDTFDGERKWLRGLRWEEIDAQLVLHHVTSKKGKKLDVPLRLAPMVMEEFRLMLGLLPDVAVTRDMLPAKGPIVKMESTDLPWTDLWFRLKWREIARACGIPDTVWNMDSRAGAITEATFADQPLENIRAAATHSDIRTTQGYSRGEQSKVIKVMEARVAHRNKKEP